jgi:hypothetical protein
VRGRRQGEDCRDEDDGQANAHSLNNAAPASRPAP